MSFPTVSQAGKSLPSHKASGLFPVLRKFWQFALMPALVCFFNIPARSQTLAHGINPANLGKGDWIRQMNLVENRLGVSTTQEVINYEVRMGMQWIAVKCGDGGDTNDWTQFSTNLVAQAHAAGLKIFAWAYVYGNTYNDVRGEINVALTGLDEGADGFLIDAEVEYEATGQSAAAAQYCQGIRARYPNTFLAHTPFPYITDHATFPYAVFGYYCDAVMPQSFWEELSLTPAQMISNLDSQWRNWQNGLTGTNRNAIKPIIPMAQSYPAATGAEITAFVNGIKADTNGAGVGGYNGLSFWECQQRNADMDTAVQAATIGVNPPPPRLQSFHLLGGGVVQLSLNGQVGDVYAVDVSSDLHNWNLVATFTNLNGSYQFTDSSFTNSGAGFYRARWISH